MTEPQPQKPRAGVPDRVGPRALVKPADLVGGLRPERPQDAGLRRYVEVLLHRKWMVLAVCATVLLAAALQLFTTTPLYTSTLILQVDPEDPNVLPFEEVDDSSSQLWMGEYLSTQVEKLRARSLGRRVAARLELAEDPAFNRPTSPGVLRRLLSLGRGLAGGGDSPAETAGETAAAAADTTLADAVLGAMTVRPIRDTRLVQVSFTWSDPEFAARVANTIGEEFIEQHLESKYEATRRATDFLDRQLEELQQRVEESEAELLRYAAENQILNLTDRETINRKKLADLSDQVTLAETELITARARQAAAARASGPELPDGLKNPAVRDLEARVAAAEQQLAGLSSRFGPQWPEVKEMRRREAELRLQLEAENAQILASARQEYELAADRYSRLSAALEQQRQAVNRLDESSIQYNILRREVESNKELYEGLLQRVKEAGVAAGLRSSNVRIADAAEVARFPSSPRKAQSLTLALIFGVLLGVAAAFLAESIDNTIKSSEEVAELLGLPSLGVVPSLGSDSARGSSWLPGRRAERTGKPILAFVDGRPTDGRAWEAYRSVRTSILLSHSVEPPQVILVSSALASEGKSTVAANTAIALAQTGERTLLVDLDLRRPTVAPLFKLPSDQGMSTYLSGNSDLSSQVAETSVPNLFAVPSGPPPPNPAELIGSPKMQSGLDLLKEYFTYVVIDSPPSLEVTDPLVLSPLVDGVILVARAGRTPRQAIRKSAEWFLRVGAVLLGVLVNDLEVSRRGYSYYYGKYGSYYASAGGSSSAGKAGD